LINNDGSDSKTSGGKKGVRWQREGRITSDWLQESREERCWQGTRQDFGLRSIKNHREIEEAGGRTEFPKSAYWEYLDPGGGIA
jgi:hypothetical protein